jgi:hypothetical protein
MSDLNEMEFSRRRLSNNNANTSRNTISHNNNVTIHNHNTNNNNTIIRNPLMSFNINDFDLDDVSIVDEEPRGSRVWPNRQSNDSTRVQSRTYGFGTRWEDRIDPTIETTKVFISIIPFSELYGSY